jgi:hypothetical protein
MSAASNIAEFRFATMNAGVMQSRWKSPSTKARSTSRIWRCSALADPSVQAKKRLGPEHWGQVLGTGRGSVQNLAYRSMATKKAICWPFPKPSDGLEPSTPSLLWKAQWVTGVHARAPAAPSPLQITPFRTAATCRQASRVLFLMCPFCVCVVSLNQTTSARSPAAQPYPVETRGPGKSALVWPLLFGVQVSLCGR